MLKKSAFDAVSCALFFYMDFKFHFPHYLVERELNAFTTFEFNCQVEFI